MLANKRGWILNYESTLKKIYTDVDWFLIKRKWNLKDDSKKEFIKKEMIVKTRDHFTNEWNIRKQESFIFEKNDDSNKREWILIKDEALLKNDAILEAEALLKDDSKKDLSIAN